MPPRPPRTAVFAGTFDPPTRGHIDLIARSRRLFDKTIVAVGNNPEKAPMFTPQERVEMLRDLSLGGESVLIVIDVKDEHLQRSARNLPGVTVLLVEGVNVYDVLRHQKMLITKQALAGIESRLARRAKESNS